jgi:hypothetical protein
MIMYRQGDVFLMRVDGAAPIDIEPKPADGRGIVLAEGESSGHHHAVFGDGNKLFRFRDTSGRQLLVTGERGAELRVVGGGSGGKPRHETIQIAPGKYIVTVQRSWTSAHQSRRVED